MRPDMLIPDLRMGWVRMLPGTGLIESPPSCGIRLSMGDMGLVPLPPMCGTVSPKQGGERVVARGYHGVVAVAGV